MTDRSHHRPSVPGAAFFSELGGGADPARVTEAADRAATLLVRGARDSEDEAITQRILHLADSEGLEAVAAAWAGAPADSLAGCLWRLYVLRTWVYADPLRAAEEFEAGRDRAQVARVVSGVAEPPGPDELKLMIDEVLTGIAEREFADVLLRAAAFAGVVATGRALRRSANAEDAARMTGLADQLERSAHLELAGRLA
ncbi:MAG: hypothetical protein ACRCYQ_11725 [Nocardioides sp.]